MQAGARIVHLHPYDAAGAETLAAAPCAAALRAVRAACPGVPISLSTSADIETDPQRRLELIGGWTELPELVTANQGEPGVVELCDHLLARGVGIEAGLLALADAHAFVASGLAGRCVRVLLEPLDAEPDRAVAHAAAIEQVLTDAEVELEQVHHGDGPATWHVMARAVSRGHGIRRLHGGGGRLVRLRRADRRRRHQRATCRGPDRDRAGGAASAPAPRRLEPGRDGARGDRLHCPCATLRALSGRAVVRFARTLGDSAARPEASCRALRGQRSLGSRANRGGARRRRGAAHGDRARAPGAGAGRSAAGCSHRAIGCGAGTPTSTALGCANPDT